MNQRMLLCGGTVLPLDGSGAPREALVIEDGRVAATGTRADMESLAGRGAQRIDLRGSTAIPGLIDSHPHMLHFAALEAGLVNLLDARNHSEIVERIRDRAASTPQGEWILATPVGEPHYFTRRSYLDLEERCLPDRTTLDRATASHPVLIQGWAPRTPNVCAFNSLGLAMAGIGRVTPDRVCDVTIEKEEDGRPTGILRGPVNNYYTDDPFWLQIMARLPRPPEALWEIGARTGMPVFNRLGVTSAYEVHAMDLAHVEAYRKVRNDGEATVRVLTGIEVSNGAFNPYSDPSAADVIAQLELAKSLTTTSDDLFRIDGVSFVRGGPCWPGYLRMHDPYLDPFGRPTRGKTFLPRALEELAIEWCAKNDLRFNMVNGGYRDHDDFLRSLEPFIEKYDIARRGWVVQHSLLITEGQARRYAALGFEMTTSVGFAWGKGDLYGERMGRQVWEDLIPLGRLMDVGLNVSCGTDWGPKNVFEQMWLAETHEFCGSGHRNLLPGHAVDRERSLAAWTRNPARLMRWEGIGSLARGAHADVAIVDKNPLTCDLDELPMTRVLRTLLGGRVVHDSGDL